MLLASLMIADELSDAYDKIKELEVRLDGAGQMMPASSGADSERRAAAMIEQVAEQLNAVAVELERA